MLLSRPKAPARPGLSFTPAASSWRTRSSRPRALLIAVRWRAVLMIQKDAPAAGACRAASSLVAASQSTHLGLHGPYMKIDCYGRDLRWMGKAAVGALV